MLTQFAGEIGLISLGLGKDFGRYSIGGMYGVVPAEYSQGPVIETINLRQTYRFYQWDRLDFYAGLSIFHVLSLQYASSKFKDSPDGYYSVGSVRGLLNLGTSVALTHDEKSSFYLEGGMNDIWIVNWFNSSNIEPENHLSLGAGFKHRF